MCAQRTVHLLSTIILNTPITAVLHPDSEEQIARTAVLHTGIEEHTGIAEHTEQIARTALLHTGIEEHTGIAGITHSGFVG